MGRLFLGMVVGWGALIILILSTLAIVCGILFLLIVIIIRLLDALSRLKVYAALEGGELIEFLLEIYGGAAANGGV